MNPFTILLFSTIYLIQFTTCKTPPLLVASHKLVRDLKSELHPSPIHLHNTTSVNNMLKKLITQCSSDAYLLINLPGLTYTDLTSTPSNIASWPFLRKYMYMASTLIGLPRMESTLDLDFLEQYIINTCEAETINVLHDDDNEVVEYFDIRKRVIRIDLSPLDQHDMDRRQGEILNYDQLIRKILRKLPSPHYSIILTSLDPGIVHPVPKVIMEGDPGGFSIFSDILDNPLHNGEVEKNDNFHKVEPNWNPIRDSNDRYLRNKKLDEIKVLDYELWVKNEKLITTIFVMILSIFMMKIVSFLNYLKQRIVEWKSQKNRKGIIVSNKKQD